MAYQGPKRPSTPSARKGQIRPKPAARQRAVAPAEGLKHPRPGTTGEGHYYQIEILSRRNFVEFRTEEIGRKGHIQRVAGQRPNGSWETVRWLIAKSDADVEDGQLVPKTANARKVFKELGSAPVHVKGDRFKTTARRNGKGSE